MCEFHDHVLSMLDDGTCDEILSGTSTLLCALMLHGIPSHQEKKGICIIGYRQIKNNLKCLENCWSTLTMVKSFTNEFGAVCNSNDTPLLLVSEERFDTRDVQKELMMSLEVGNK